MSSNGQSGRDRAMELIDAALAAVEPAAAVRRHLTLAGDRLRLAGREYDLNRLENVYVIGAGKASGAMAAAVEGLLGDRVSEGIVLVKGGYTAATRRIRLVEAGHPIPDRAGLEGAQEIMALAERAGRGDLVVALISGGGSALLTCPVEGVTLADLRMTTDALLRSGATIKEFNTVRKHLSQVKGGKLARMVAPAPLMSLVVSDVVGSPLDTIASGPTVPDTTTFADALMVLERYGLEDQVPRSVLDYLRESASAGHDGESETPKPGDPIFDWVCTEIIASNELAASAAVTRAKELGFNALLLSTFIEGEARAVGSVMAGIAREVRQSGRPVAPPACIVAGGETTVTVRGDGQGGRNQELALAAALAIDGLDRTMVVGLATDGTDGPTDAAGAWVDGSTVQRGEALGLSAVGYLANNDAYNYFRQLGDLIVTGPTNTNVNDLILILVR